MPDDGGSSTGIFINSSTYDPVTAQINDSLKINVTNGTSLGQTTGFSSGDDITVTGKNMEVSATGQATGTVDSWLVRTEYGQSRNAEQCQLFCR